MRRLTHSGSNAPCRASPVYPCSTGILPRCCCYHAVSAVSAIVNVKRLRFDVCFLRTGRMFYFGAMLLFSDDSRQDCAAGESSSRLYDLASANDRCGEVERRLVEGRRTQFHLADQGSYDLNGVRYEGTSVSPGRQCPHHRFRGSHFGRSTETHPSAHG
jgi:hypothetical protein